MSKFDNYKQFYYVVFRPDVLLGKSKPEIITHIDIKAKHWRTKEKLYPFLSNKDVIGKTLAPADKFTMNFIERTLPLQLSFTYLTRITSVIGTCPKTKSIAANIINNNP